MDSDPRSFGRLLVDAVDQSTKLLRSEVAVARAELAEKARQAASGAALLAVAGLLLIPVAVLLLLALASWLSELGLRPSLAQACAAGAGLIIVGLIALIGKSKVSPRNLSPTHTLKELSHDADAAQRAL